MRPASDWLGEEIKAPRLVVYLGWALALGFLATLFRRCFGTYDSP